MIKRCLCVFFEELHIAIEAGTLDKKIVKEMFSYYAEEFSKDNNLMREANDEPENWMRFNSFIEIMSKVRR